MLIDKLKTIKDKCHEGLLFMCQMSIALCCCYLNPIDLSIIGGDHFYTFLYIFLYLNTNYISIYLPRVVVTSWTRAYQFVTLEMAIGAVERALKVPSPNYIEHYIELYRIISNHLIQELNSIVYTNYLDVKSHNQLIILNNANITTQQKSIQHKHTLI